MKIGDFGENKANQIALFYPKIPNLHFYDIRNSLEPFWMSSEKNKEHLFYILFHIKIYKVKLTLLGMSAIKKNKTKAFKPRIRFLPRVIGQKIPLLCDNKIIPIIKFLKGYMKLNNSFHFYSNLHII